MTIAFRTNILLLGLLFVMSPFAPQADSPRTTMAQLPLIAEAHAAVRWWRRRTVSTLAATEP